MAVSPSSCSPCPDGVDEAGASPEPSPPPPSLPPLSTTSSDEIGLLLSQPTPDPYLREATGTGSTRPGPDPSHRPREQADGSSTEGGGAPFPSPDSDAMLPIRLSSEEHHAPDVFGVGRLDSSSGDDSSEALPSRVSWSFLVVSSYASALTLALLWMYWSGRSLSRSNVSAMRDPRPSAGRLAEAGPSDRPARVLSLPESRLTDLGRAIRLGDIEVIPRGINHQGVEMVRLLGETDDRREAEPALRLTLQLRNLSRTESFAPLDASLVRESTSGSDQPCLELSGGRRVPLFRLAPESEWSIVGQDFPSLAPGEAAETVLFTEPIPMSALAEPLIWHVKVRTGPFQTDVLGVRFSARDVQVIEPLEPSPPPAE